MSPKTIVIGAGIAGLAAGCYARMNGYDVEVLEMHDKPGGLCTSWKRKGYTVDGCVHWVVGSTPAVSGLHQCWRELGAIKNIEYHDHDVYMSVFGKDGKVFHGYTNVDRLEKHLLELSPADEKTIREFTGAVRKFRSFEMPMPKPKELRSFIENLSGLIKMAPHLYPFLKYARMSLRDFSKKFKDPFLREAFPIPFDLPDFPMVAVIFSYAWFDMKTAGYPIGGSLNFAREIERRLLELGGKITYRARVEKILVENGRAVGVRLDTGDELRADLVISAADGHATIFKMLEGKYISDKIREYYDSLPRFRPLIQASFGIGRDMRDEPEFAAIELDEPIEIGGEKQTHVAFHNYSYDPTMAPEGKAVVVFRLMSDYDRWKEIKEDKQAYKEEKQKIADIFTGILETRYPGISEQIEMIDVASPTTYERYTGNWEGSMEGWLITTKSIMKDLEKTLPGLANFYMVGQWVQPGGGLPSCALTAREVMQMICHRDGKTFTTTAE